MIIDRNEWVVAEKEATVTLDSLDNRVRLFARHCPVDLRIAEHAGRNCKQFVLLLTPWFVQFANLALRYT